ncbi:hypothetical protein H5410_061168 [Solanum commersonii]|uniref:Uncharacterized protein n=1 Tax=Solanum commersonii TaxID=4109 RepID=A0A9J5W794_SOLCO|nr:hypothetical protein H5410_061168 [Solanum commersonii]
MNAHTRLNLLMRRSNVHSKFQVVTHHYRRISSSLYLLRMKVQTQQRKSNALTQRMIPYSHTMVKQFKVSESNTTLTLTKKNTIILSPISLPIFSNRQLFQLTKDQKGLFKACNGAESKGVPFFQNHGLKETFLALIDLPSLFTTPPT